jgi:hypothetical protein
MDVYSRMDSLFGGGASVYAIEKQLK